MRTRDRVSWKLAAYCFINLCTDFWHSDCLIKYFQQGSKYLVVYRSLWKTATANHEQFWGPLSTKLELDSRFHAAISKQPTLRLRVQEWGYLISNVASALYSWYSKSHKMRANRRVHEIGTFRYYSRREYISHKSKISFSESPRSVLWPYVYHVVYQVRLRSL